VATSSHHGTTHWSFVELVTQPLPRPHARWPHARHTAGAPPERSRSHHARGRCC